MPIRLTRGKQHAWRSPYFAVCMPPIQARAHAFPIIPTAFPFASANRSIDCCCTDSAFFANASVQDCDALINARKVCS